MHSTKHTGCVLQVPLGFAAASECVSSQLASTSAVDWWDSAKCRWESSHCTKSMNHINEHITAKHFFTSCDTCHVTAAYNRNSCSRKGVNSGYVPTAQSTSSERPEVVGMFAPFLAARHLRTSPRKIAVQSRHTGNGSLSDMQHRSAHVRLIQNLAAFPWQLVYCHCATWKIPWKCPSTNYCTLCLKPSATATYPRFCQ